MMPRVRLPAQVAHERRMEDDQEYRRNNLAECRRARKSWRNATIKAKAEKDFVPGGLLTSEQVAVRLHVDPRTVHRWVRERRISCVQLSPKRRLFTESQVQDFIQSRTIQKPPSANVCRKSSVDRVTNRALASNPKGGEQEKIQGKELRAQLRKEMRSW
jgi:excisionase family DNA binding protein